MLLTPIRGGWLYTGESACGCDPSRAGRPHACTNASTTWACAVADGAVVKWVRVRSGAAIRLRAHAFRGTDLAEMARMIEGEQ